MTDFAEGYTLTETLDAEGRVVLPDEYTPCAVWCNATGNHYIEQTATDEQTGCRTFVVRKVPDPTAEELAAAALAQAKQERADAVEKIIVEVDGMKFDGGEEAQSRMARTVATAIALGVDIDTEKRTWVLADNTIATPTIRQLARATELAGNQMTKLWTVPYESEKA